ncbi:MAG: zinc-ribbon domain-containing protein [Gammaproteobacteria bacterium]|nr:zinc-ribbon domain-containing protein [Gammaproteobacteria bacterium]
MALGKCKECGKEVSTTAKTCPNCGVKRPFVSDMEKFGDKWGCLIIVLIGVLGFYVYTMSDSSEYTTHVNTASKSGTICSGDGKNGRSLAYTYAQDLVKMNLRSPSTADFPFSDFQWRMHSKTADDSCIFTIKSYVDAQNAFGATVRHHYVAELKYHKRRWSFHDLTMN